MSIPISRRRVLVGGLSSALAASANLHSARPELPIVLPDDSVPRMHYGAEHLKSALQSTGITAEIVTSNSPPEGRCIVVGDSTVHELVRKALASAQSKGEQNPEGFQISSVAQRIVIDGNGSGAMYGCFELADRVQASGALPRDLHFSDAPKLRIRGTNLLWMKSGSLGYDWPLTRENFPWFFDRNLMRRYLDELAEARFNTVFFWSGHAFPYLLKLPRYPEAQMLSTGDLESNIEHFRWFTTEADRRGIWTVLHFYNIHVPAAFAQRHAGEGVRVSNPLSTPLLAAYTRYCMSEFVSNYPNVGLLVCAGEALETGKEEWIRDVIVQGIMDSGKQPPLIVREWTIDLDRFKNIVLPSYSNLYTMMKHNVEMVVSPVPDPRNREWTKLGPHHLINVHENGDIKPLRWGSPSFIQEMVQEWLKIGVVGAHVYPAVSWQWPVTLDNTVPPLLTIDRDWIWLQAFGRYSWNPAREPQVEREHWIGELDKRFGSRAAAEHLLAYYELSGSILPGIQNLLSIHNMNAHPTLVGRDANVNAILNSIRMNSLNVPLTQPLDGLAVSQYVQKFGGNREQLRSKPPLSVHEYVASPADSPGLESAITPPKLFELFQELADQSLEHARKGAGLATRNRDEAGRFTVDAEIMKAAVSFYQSKTQAAICKGLYDRRGEPGDADQMIRHLEQSVEHYEALCRIGSRAYVHASDLAGVVRWEKMLGAFRDELAFYKQQGRLSESGADILCLGVNGPFEDYTNAFHWSLCAAAQNRNRTMSTYMIREPMIKRARLIAVYSLSDPWTRGAERMLLDWVAEGGHLLVWDEEGRLSPASGLIHDLEVVGAAEERLPVGGTYGESIKIQFGNLEHALVGSLQGATMRGPGSVIPNNIKPLGNTWNILAHTIVFNKDYEFLPVTELAGSFWVKRNDSQFCPLMLERPWHEGKIAVLQLGRWQNDNRVHRQFCATLADNILAWAGV